MELIDPASLFTPRRLDLCVKYLYANALINGSREDLFERLYVRHILKRTGGREPHDYAGQPSPKHRIEDYISSFRVLIENLKTTGYDTSHPIPLMADGTLANGAHRLSACRALNKLVSVTHVSGNGGNDWDFNWFVRQGFAISDLMRILHCWTFLDTNVTVIVLWSAVQPIWFQLIDMWRSKLELVGSVSLDFQKAPRAAFDSLILDLYAGETSDQENGLRNIERKCDLLAPFSPELQVLLFTRGQHTPEDFSASAFKNEIRSYASGLAPIDYYITCHVSDSLREARHMADTLLCPEYVDAAKLRRRRRPRSEFLRWINNYTRVISEQKLDIKDCCIVGSSPLEIVEIRNSTDIDFALREDVRDKIYSGGSVSLGANVDLVSRGYHRSNRRGWISDSELSSNPDWHFQYRGCKFANIDVVCDRKDFSRRPKDCNDVALFNFLRNKGQYSEWLNELRFIDFRCGGNLAEFAVSGWSPSGHWGTWTNEHCATLLLPVPRLAFCHVEISADLTVGGTDAHCRRVAISANQTGIGEWDVSPGEIAQRTATIPAKLIGNAARFTLSFELVAPHSTMMEPGQHSLGLITLSSRAVRE